MAKLLRKRLVSSQKADWEGGLVTSVSLITVADLPGVLYLSDMAPYLIRVACCFEGPSSRYRLDPKKCIDVLNISSCK